MQNASKCLFVLKKKFVWLKKKRKEKVESIDPMADSTGPTISSVGSTISSTDLTIDSNSLIPIQPLAISICRIELKP